MASALSYAGEQDDRAVAGRGGLQVATEVDADSRATFPYTRRRMTLTTRIVAALVLAALIPMAVVLAVPLVQAGKRASEETSLRLERARGVATFLIESQRATTGAAADHAAKDLANDREGLAALVRGPESVADPVVGTLASRFGLDRVEVLSASGATLAASGADAGTPGTAVLVERRRVVAEAETLTLVATRLLGPPFVEGVAAITPGKARLGAPGDPACPEPRIEVAVTETVALCVTVVPADARALRFDLLRSFAGVAPAAFLAALAVGLILAARIARPIHDLARRAESIAAQHRGPMTLLPEPDETRRMTIAFDQMLDSLEASERRRVAAERVAEWEEIAKRLAHEIKNPLSPIQLAVENLRRTRERSPEGFDEAFAEETRTILEEVASLRSLVDEFAQFARLPRPNVAACAPRAIVEQALALFAARIGSMRVAVSVELPSDLPDLFADSEQVGRILKNVIANALDAMDEAQERTLSVTVRREGEHVVFAVRDSGRGFDADSLRRVFTPYFTTRADRGGTGLGMAIARRIAVEHGGSLDAYGAPDRGATITLTLPIAGPPREDA